MAGCDDPRILAAMIGDKIFEVLIKGTVIAVLGLLDRCGWKWAGKWLEQILGTGSMR